MLYCTLVPGRWLKNGGLVPWGWCRKVSHGQLIHCTPLCSAAVSKTPRRGGGGEWEGRGGGGEGKGRERGVE
jgi:hypothetical protein